jgi:regulator of PEP synthase PpsR (kinase-PPPase family)
MDKKILDILKQNNAKFLLVDEELQEIITRLSEKLDTNTHDVVKTAVKLLEKSIGKKVILRNKKNNIDEVISAFEDL